MRRKKFCCCHLPSNHHYHRRNQPKHLLCCHREHHHRICPTREKENARRKKKQETTNKKEEKGKKALAELSNRCAKSLCQFVDKDLTEEEWHKFCELVRALPKELKEIMHKFGQRRGDPTRNWRRRQQRKSRRD